MSRNPETVMPVVDRRLSAARPASMAVFRVMAFKELREVRGIALLALAVYGLLVLAILQPTSVLGVLGQVMSYRFGGVIPLVSDDFVGRYFWISAAMAIALGLRQTVGESVRGTYLLLLHRPATWRSLIGTKLLVGAAVYLACAMVPLLTYCLWAATPGTHASPFQWSMTVPSWIGWLAMLTIYLGAFLSGIRPASWYRSRLLPLLAAAVPVVVVIGSAPQPWWQPWSIVILLLADIWLAAMIVFVVRTRDYS